MCGGCGGGGVGGGREEGRSSSSLNNGLPGSLAERDWEESRAAAGAGRPDSVTQ